MFNLSKTIKCGLTIIGLSCSLVQAAEYQDLYMDSFIKGDSNYKFFSLWGGSLKESQSAFEGDKALKIQMKSRLAYSRLSLFAQGNSKKNPGIDISAYDKISFWARADQESYILASMGSYYDSDYNYLGHVSLGPEYQYYEFDISSFNKESINSLLNLQVIGKARGAKKVNVLIDKIRLLDDETTLTPMNDVSKAELEAITQGVASRFGVPVPSEYLNSLTFDVSTYKLRHVTKRASGESVIASGLVTVPKNIPIAPKLWMYSHGTITSKAEAPSNPGSTGNFVSSSLSSIGTITLAPDYIGLGDGEGLHPFVHKESFVQSNIDFINAAKEALDEAGISYQNKILLSGFSEGGYSTMVTAEALEDGATDVELLASFPMSGPYDLAEDMGNIILQEEPYEDRGFLPFVLLGYNGIYNLYDNLNDVFVDSVASRLDELYDGSNNLSTISSQLPALDELFQEDFKESFALYNLFRQRLEENNGYEWVPTKPMFLMYCENDEAIPVANTFTAYNYFIDNGSVSTAVIPVQAPVPGHRACFFPSVLTSVFAASPYLQ